MLYMYERMKGKPVARCAECDCDLYEGESVYRIGDDVYCEFCVETEVLERDEYERL